MSNIQPPAVNIKPAFRNYLGKKGKIRTLYNRVICRTTFNNNNLNFIIQANIFANSFLHASVHCCLRAFIYALLRSHHSISIGWGLNFYAIPTHWVFFFFSHSDVDFLLCLVSLSGCMTKFWPSLSCWTVCENRNL